MPWCACLEHSPIMCECKAACVGFCMSIQYIPWPFSGSHAATSFFQNMMNTDILSGDEYGLSEMSCVLITWLSTCRVTRAVHSFFFSILHIYTVQVATHPSHSAWQHTLNCIKSKCAWPFMHNTTVSKAAETLSQFLNVLWCYLNVFPDDWLLLSGLWTRAGKECAHERLTARKDRHTILHRASAVFCH